MIYAERARIETPCACFYSKHSRVMTWQAHDSGHTPSPLPTGRAESEDTQVKLALFEHSFEQVELTAILSFDCTCYFQHIWLLLKISCQLQIRGYEGFIAQQPQIREAIGSSTSAYIYGLKLIHNKLSLIVLAPGCKHLPECL